MRNIAIEWCWEDLQDLHPDWTEEECKEWMTKNRDWFEDAVIEYGNEVLSRAVHSNEILSCSE